VSRSVSVAQLATLYLDLSERRRWDNEFVRSMSLGEVSDSISVEYLAFGSVMGGLVSGRDYVDVRAIGEDNDKKQARAYWG
jgi:hypothetical protein